MGVELTNRDIKLLQEIAKFGVITMDNAKQIYGNALKYHMRRTTKLSKEGYIIKNHGFIRMGVRGRAYITENNNEIMGPVFNKLTKKRLQTISEIKGYIDQKTWLFIPSWEAKKDLKLNRGSKVLGFLKGRQTYAVFKIGIIPKEDPEVLNSLKKDIDELKKVGICRIIVFTNVQETIESFALEGFGLEEFLLLPFPPLSDTGIRTINHIGKEELVERVANVLFENAFITSWNAADFRLENGKYVSVLINNDIEKRSKLDRYFKIFAGSKMKINEVVIVCLKEQEFMIKEAHPQCQIIAVDLSYLLK